MHTTYEYKRCAAFTSKLNTYKLLRVMNIFVTGGSGFLGKRLIMRLVGDGHTVSSLARSLEAADIVKSLGATPLIGELTNIPEWERALSKFDVVIHAASPVEFWGKWEHFERDIVRSTSELYASAAENNVRRFIYISSESVLQATKPLLDITEQEPYPDEPNSLYGKAKKLAEQALMRSQGITDCVILRPTFIWGKGVPALEILLEKMKTGRFRWIDGGKTVIECVYIDNVVEAIICALTRGRHKCIYNITDDSPKTVRELITALVATQGVIPPEKNTSIGLARLIASLAEGIWNVFKLDASPPLSRFEMSFVSMPRRYNIRAAKEELGYTPRVAFAQGLEEMKKG
ncbi:MAG: NAD(P)-dependent oxidoreductase [Candidatus Kapaibacterium sp.]|nr:MAG: NAD(P)-dependent oxidoreductase [Candidatus Kapabacteria bacterium]